MVKSVALLHTNTGYKRKYSHRKANQRGPRNFIILNTTDNLFYSTRTESSQCNFMKSLISGFSAEFLGLHFSDKFQMKSRADAVGDFGETFLDSYIRDLMHRK
jgi:hypothetical protein